MASFLQRIYHKGLSILSSTQFIGNGSNQLYGSYVSASQIFGMATDAICEQYLESHPVAMRCLDVLCTSSLEPELKVGTRNEAHEMEPLDGDHDMLNLVMNPTRNHEITYAQFLRHLIANQRATGVAYVWIWRTKGGAPGELWPLPTSWVLPIPKGKLDLADTEENRWVKDYELLIPGAAYIQHIPPEDMIVIRRSSAFNYMGGVSSIRACYRELRSDEVVGEYIAQRYKNDQLPGLVLKQPKELSPDAKEKIRALFLSRFSLDSGGMGRPLFMSGDGAGIESLPALADLGYPNATSRNETRICMTMGVPPEVIQCWAALQKGALSSDTTDSTMNLFARFTLVPLWMEMAEALTYGLLEKDSKEELYFDTAKVKALQEDHQKTATRSATLFSASIITRNEAREMNGLEPDDQRGEVYLQPMALQEITANEKPEPPPEPVTPEEHQNGLAVLSKRDANANLDGTAGLSGIPDRVASGQQ